MLFRVENLGPIREAQVDLSKDLIILTGPNNSGKTYFAWAVYGLERFEPQEALPSVERWVDELLARPEDEHNIVPLLESESVLTELGEAFSSVIHEEFVATRALFASTRASVRRANAGVQQRRHQVSSAISLADPEKFLILVSSSSGGASLALRTRPGPESKFAEAPLGLLSAQEWAYARKYLCISVANQIRLLLRLRHKTILFPVERLAINIFAKELAERRTEFVDSLRELAEGGNVGEVGAAVTRSVERYPRAIRDALHDAVRLDAYSRQTTPFSDLADELEMTVLGGRIMVSQDNVLEFTPGRSDSGPRLRIQQTASVVKSLASLVFYFRHRARGDERLIIDEPELNLHPDNQRKVARVLAKAVNRGIQVIMSTHSDYMIREFNNLIMLSQDSDAARGLRDELGYQPEMTLRPERLGVYLFGADGLCTELPVSETGFEVKTIDDEIHRLNQEVQTIYSRLFLGE